MISQKVLALVLAAFALPSMILAPASAQSDFTVLSSSDYIDSIDFYHIVGELQNNSDRVVRFVEVTATLYDDQDVVVGRPFGFALIDVMRPGERSPFHVIFTDSEQINKIVSYKLSISSTPLTVDKERSLELKVGEGYLDSIGFYHLVGEVTNNGDRTATFVEVSAAFYDSNGNIVDTATGFTSPSDVGPGMTEAFEILSVSPNGHAITSASANADSTQYANIPEFPPALMTMAAGVLGALIGVARLKRKNPEL